MIRFRTIEPEPAAKAAPTAPLAAPQPEPAPADQGGAVAKPKGLTRKTPLRAKRREPASLFDGKAADGV